MDPRYVHFVVKPYDPSIDYESICKALFCTNRCLAMMEKKGGDHLHVQGECSLPDKEIDIYLKNNVIVKHYRTIQAIEAGDPSLPRPCKRVRKEVTEKGFQYMSKDVPQSVLVYKQVFTDDDIQDLYEKSEAHRAELQSKLGEYLSANCVRGAGESPRNLHKRLCGLAIRYYLDQDKMQPPNIKLLVRHFLGKYYVEEDVIEYLSELIM